MLIREILLENEDGLITPSAKLDAEALASLNGEKEYDFDGKIHSVNISREEAKKILKGRVELKKDEIGIGGLSAIISTASAIFALKDQISNSMTGG